LRFPAEESTFFSYETRCFHRVASSWLGDLFVVVPGQWRRIIGSSQNAATPKFIFFADRRMFKQNPIKAAVFSTI
ncbi:MAG: hypothetical protein ACRDAJ_02640, partial [Serratia fonticola]